MTNPNHPSPDPSVLAVVIAGGDEISGVLKSIDTQVYGLQGVVVVAEAGQKLESEGPMPRVVRSMSQVLALAGDRVEYLWLVDARTTARPDALGALVATAIQVDASVVGSKVLDAADPRRLQSVGGATDVFGFPYTGLDRGEIDQEQFDVIRDVAYVEPASILVRRDLVGGLGGLDTKLPYVATGLDLCQRARVAGGRIVVAPTSEVFAPSLGNDRINTWREQAGRIRVMLKTYSLVTLQWAIPGLLLLGLLASVYRTFRGSVRAVPDWLRAWSWNARYLSSTIEMRRKAPTASTSSDAELFRFQVRGSVELRGLASELSALLSSSGDEEVNEYEIGASPAFWRRPAVMGAFLGGAFILILGRSLLLDGLPAVGFVLPLADSARDTLRAYAGGWHLGGLGSPAPMHPSVGVTAAVQFLLGNRAGLAAVVLTVGSAASGLAGTAVLLGRCGSRPGARLLSGVVLVAGFPMLFLASDAYWPGMLAMGGLPWSLAMVASPPPRGSIAWLGRLSRMGLATVWSAMFVPLLAAAPLLFGLIRAVFARRWMAPLFGAAATLIALPPLFPWLLARETGGLVTGGAPLHLDPSWWAWPPVVVAALMAVWSGRGRPADVASTGMVLGAVGFFLARSGDLGSGREPTAAGILLVAVGVAMIVAGAVDGPSTLDDVRPSRRMLSYVGMVAGIVVGITAVSAAPAGRMGLPEDRFAALEFAQSRADPHGPDRILMVGPDNTLPGEYRRLPDGTAYRLIGGVLDYPQAWLPGPLGGDLQLEQDLGALLSDSQMRPGGALAEYGIKWVVATGPNPLSPVMSTQLDMRALTGLFTVDSGGVWEYDGASYRAVTDSGVPWSWSPPDYAGPRSGETVEIRENADPRWGRPGTWEMEGWANRVTTESGTAVFGGVPSYRVQAQVGAVWVLALIVTALACRTARRPAGLL